MEYEPEAIEWIYMMRLESRLIQQCNNTVHADTRTQASHCKGLMPGQDLQGLGMVLWGGYMVLWSGYMVLWPGYMVLWSGYMVF